MYTSQRIYSEGYKTHSNSRRLPQSAQSMYSEATLHAEQALGFLKSEKPRGYGVGHTFPQLLKQHHKVKILHLKIIKIKTAYKIKREE